MGLSSPPNRERDARDENDLLRRLLRLAKAQGKETPGKRYSDHTLAEKINEVVQKLPPAERKKYKEISERQVYLFITGDYIKETGVRKLSNPGPEVINSFVLFLTDATSTHRLVDRDALTVQGLTSLLTTSLLQYLENGRAPLGFKNQVQHD